MKKLFTTILVLSFAFLAQGQSLKISRYIMATDTVTDDGVTFAASSDDAEQENDAIDALYDDDLDAGWEGAPDDLNVLTTGLRFQKLGIPKGATIDSAYIIISSHEAKSATDVAELTITAEKTADAATFNETDLITDRTNTTANVEWTVDEEWGLWTTHRTPDLTDIVQEVVDLNDWKAGNSIAFIIAGENQGPSDDENAREFESFENIADPEDGGDGQNHPERVPQLVVYFSVNSAKADNRIIATDTVTDDGVTFAASSDDAEQENDAIDALFDDDLDAGWEGAPDDQNVLTTGLRFQNVYVPQGATIDSAFIVVYSHEAKSATDVANLTIAAHNTGNAPTFDEENLIDSRPMTSVTVDWTVAEEWGLWTPHRTPELKTLVQAVVDRQDWESGNAIAFIILGEDQGPSDDENAREFESFENIADPEDGGDGQNHPERVPQLIIYYSSADGTASVKEVSAIAENAVNIYPNPAESELHIQTLSSAPATIEVYDLTGSSVKSTSTNGGIYHTLTIEDLNPGVYYINITQDGNSTVKKLIVQ